MRITTLGIGEAFDPDQPNSSSLVEHQGFTLLIDCGHSVPPILWRARPDPTAIDAVFLTHHHADHVAGLPPVIDKWGYQGRRTELLIVTTADGHNQIRALLDLLDIVPQFPIRYELANLPTLGPFALKTAPTQHYVPNLALRLEAGGRRFAYSGDGYPTDEARALYAEADLLLQECWAANASPGDPYHSDLAAVRSIEGPRRIGLYHIRAGGRAELEAVIAGDPRLFVLQAGQTLTL